MKLIRYQIYIWIRLNAEYQIIARYKHKNKYNLYVIDLRCIRIKNINVTV